MESGSLFQAAPVLLGFLVWVLKKVRDRRRKEIEAIRGGPEFRRGYEPIEVFGNRRAHPPRDPEAGGPIA